MNGIKTRRPRPTVKTTSVKRPWSHKTKTSPVPALVDVFEKRLRDCVDPSVSVSGRNTLDTSSPDNQADITLAHDSGRIGFVISQRTSLQDDIFDRARMRSLMETGRFEQVFRTRMVDLRFHLEDLLALFSLLVPRLFPESVLFDLASGMSAVSTKNKDHFSADRWVLEYAESVADILCVAQTFEDALGRIPVPALRLERLHRDRLLQYLPMLTVKESFPLHIAA